MDPERVGRRTQTELGNSQILAPSSEGGDNNATIAPDPRVEVAPGTGRGGIDDLFRRLALRWLLRVLGKGRGGNGEGKGNRKQSTTHLVDS